MSLYLKQIEQLISLQKVDAEIHGIKVELENAPKELDSLRKTFADVESRRLRQEDKASHLREQEKRLGIEIEDDSVRLKKSKSKLMQVGNSKEYHAMVREMDSLERVNRNREEEKVALIEEVERQKTASQEIDTEFAAVEAELKTCEAGLEARVKAAQASLERLNAERSKTAVGVPAPVFSRYEFIRERLRHPVIVSVSGGVCTGCNISIPPQSFIELQKGTQILSCPNCRRLMYWSEHFHPGE